nr:PREDICTED: solute carrier family 25 member 43 [Latimeria chalumnae]|eukprot:XP_006003956.1 PREDICTED: solute carrier family 25 member 43 [Latimeria chalumnae]
MATLIRDNRVTFSQNLICGGAAGVLSGTATAPLEVVKVLAQVGTFHTKQGFSKTFQIVYSTEGPRAFWKGNFVACVRLFPYSAIHLSTFNKFVHVFMDDLGHISQWSTILAGGLAGIVAAIVTYPTEVIQTRLIVQNSLDPTYKGFLHAFHTINHQEGFLALYRGASLTILGAIPFSAGSYFVYVNLDKVRNEQSVRFTPLQNFINGCLASGVAQTLSFPFETVKRKMQIVPYFGLMFTTFECCKRVCLYKNGYIVSPLSNKLTPGVDQSLQPQELHELRKFLKKKKFETEKSALNN